MSVDDLAIEMHSAPEPGLSMSMAEMAYHETLSEGGNTYDVGTVVTDFDADFDGTTSDLLDDAKGLIQKIIMGTAVEGEVAMGELHYTRYDMDSAAVTREASTGGITLKVRLAIPEFSIKMDLNSFAYKDGSRDISCLPIKYDFWVGIDPSIDIGSITGLKSFLKALRLRSVAEITAEDGYTFTIDEGRAFMALLSTEGLRVICGDDTLTFQSTAVFWLRSGDDVVVSYHRLTADEIKEKVPKSVRERLNGGEVIELTNSAGIEELQGEVKISVKTDLDPDGAEAYRIDTDRNKLVKEDSSADGGYVEFRTDTMGLHAVSGPLTEPDRTALA